MLKPILTALLGMCILSNAQAQWSDPRPQPPKPPSSLPEAANIPNKGLYQGLQVGAIAMEIAGPVLIFRGVRADIDNWQKNLIYPEPKRVNSEPFYVAGASVLMAGIVLNVFANAKLYPNGFKATGNGISYNIPRTNKHFGQ
jgi:hypothetical protein